MTSLPIAKDIAELLKKYQDEHSDVEILRTLATVAKLQESNILLKDRLRKDLYSLFEKDENGTMTSQSGRELLENVTVKKHQVAQTCLVYQIDAEVQFDFSQATSTDKTIKNKSSKRSAEAMLESPSSNSKEGADIVNLKYHYSEQTVGAGSGTNSSRETRDEGVTVIEAPYKSINLIIAMSRGLAGLEPENVLDFQLLTAGCSPSSQQVSLQDMMRNQQESESDNESQSESASGQEDEDNCSEGSNSDACIFNDGGHDDDDDDHGDDNNHDYVVC